MSGMWIVAQEGDDGKPLYTTNVEGLDRLRRQARFYAISAVVVTLIMGGGMVGGVWSRVGWLVALTMAFNIALVFGVALLAGMFVGRYSAWRDIADANVGVSQIIIDEERGA